MVFQIDLYNEFKHVYFLSNQTDSFLQIVATKSENNSISEDYKSQRGLP